MPVYSYISRATERTLFTQAELALKKKNFTLYKQLSVQLKNYPLYSYLKFSELEHNIANVSLKELQEFINAYPDSPLGPKLRNIWLYHNAKKQNWYNFLVGYQYSDNIELQCYYIWSHYQIKREPSILKYVEPIWLTGKSQPPACNAVFSSWEKHHVITRSILWQRIKLAIHSNNHSLARFLAKKLNKTEASLVELWIRTSNNPYLINKNHYFTEKHPAIVEILVHGISKIASKDAKTAINIWKQIAKKHPFTEKHWATVVKDIGISLAKAKHPDAEKWLSKISPNYMDQSILEARLFFALYNKNWQNVVKITKQLPAPLNKNEQWLYWKARALEVIGKRNESHQIFQKLAKQRSYYGFLSSVKAATNFSFKNQSTQFCEKDLLTVAKKPALIRAYELHQINKNDIGSIEWNYALRNMTDKEKEIAAAIAAKWKLPNWSITALMTSSKKNNLTLRFPRNYAKQIFREADINQIDPAFIFAITRQESAFVTTARSYAGALGLMQLIPSTAQWIAKITNERRIINTKELFYPDTNIRFGSKYLRMMLNKYKQNSVLVAAAYNAGPGRVRQWLPKYDLPSDIWIELIPFKETRGYVKNILTYTVIYQQLLGNTPTITKHMPVIHGTKQLVAKK
jgi:soluble lytic murein transglycosylase